jgi:hypothetical protein
MGEDRIMDEKKYHLKFRDRLLSQLSEIFNHIEKRQECKMINYEIALQDEEGEELVCSSPATVLHYVVEDLYWDETGEWQNAYKAVLRKL